MKIVVFDDYSSVCKYVSDEIVSQIIKKPKSVLGLATGSTPLGVYKSLVERYQAKEISFKQITSYNLDEYVGINPRDINSYHYFMNVNLFKHIDIQPENINIPDGQTQNIEKECMNFDNKIYSSGGIDLQLLGLGGNGHIGFNEPGPEFMTTTHVVNLNNDTIVANSRFFESVEEVPKQAITMGIKTIFDAKKIILVACGQQKKDIVKKLLQSKITPEIQASILHLHRDITVVLDRQAASEVNQYL